jgi:hypothetical protein
VDKEPEVELEFNQAISSELIQRKVDEAIKRALAKLEEKQAKPREKSALDPAAKSAKAADKARLQAERLAAQAHKEALQKSVEQLAQVKQLAAQAQREALREHAMQLENAERLVAELQLKALREDAKSVEQARQQELSKAQLHEREQEIAFLDKALHQRANDERFEQLAAMVKQLSIQVERLQRDVSALRDQHADGKARETQGDDNAKKLLNKIRTDEKRLKLDSDLKQLRTDEKSLKLQSI